MLNDIKIWLIAVLLVVAGCCSIDSQAKGNYKTGESKEERLAKICEPYIELIKTYATTGDTQAHLDYFNVQGTKEYNMCLRDYPKLSQAIYEANKMIEQHNNQTAQNIKNKYKKS